MSLKKKIEKNQKIKQLKMKEKPKQKIIIITTEITEQI